MHNPIDASARQLLIELGLTFFDELGVHHDREETYLFPKLPARMPEFGPQSLLVDQHKKIHVGLTVSKQYLLDCHNEEEALNQADMEKIVDVFSETLLAHLDDEVYAFRAEKNRQHWTLDQLKFIHWP